MHQLTVRVYYEGTDAGGVVYYANYLSFFLRARIEWGREQGGQPEVLARQGFTFPVRSARVDYLKPAIAANHGEPKAEVSSPW